MKKIGTHLKYVLPFSDMNETPSCETDLLISSKKQTVQMILDKFVNITRNFSHLILNSPQIRPPISTVLAPGHCRTLSSFPRHCGLWYSMYSEELRAHSPKLNSPPAKPNCRHVTLVSIAVQLKEKFQNYELYLVS